jgi:hypothetical protein
MFEYRPAVFVGRRNAKKNRLLDVDAEQRVV